jgi:hypothetical protein
MLVSGHVRFHGGPRPARIGCELGKRVPIVTRAAIVDHIVLKIACEQKTITAREVRVLIELDPPSMRPRGYGIVRPTSPGIAAVV